MMYDEFVNRPYRMWRKVLHKSDEVIRIEAICTKSTSVFGERVQSSFQNSQEKNYAILIDAKKELEELMEEHRKAEDEVRRFLYDNLTHEEADLLEWKYIDGKSAKDIAKILKEREQTVRNKVSRSDRKARAIFMKV
ncbi:MAG: hypothetical protein IIY21_03575 [Clostridiales bacterium]|nr:hypothetical protein [Clostridiales bacterium]